MTEDEANTRSKAAEAMAMGQSFFLVTIDGEDGEAHGVVQPGDKEELRFLLEKANEALKEE